MQCANLQGHSGRTSRPASQNIKHWRSGLHRVVLATLITIVPLSGHGASPDPSSGGTNPATPPKEQSQSSTSTTQTGPAEPKDKLPTQAIDASRNRALQNAIQPGAGTTGSTGNSATTAARNQANSGLKDTTGNQAGFDQGFANKPTTISGAGNLNGNPMTTTSGCGPGIVGSAACGQTGSTGLAGKGTSLISQDGNANGGGAAPFAEGGRTLVGGTASRINANGTVNTDGLNPAAKNPFENLGDANVRAGVKGDVSNRQQQMDSANCDLGVQAACDRMNASKKEQEQKTGTTGEQTTTGSGERVVTHESGNTTTYHADGTVTHRQNNKDFSYTETTVKKTANKDGTTTTTITRQHYNGSGQKQGDATTTSSTSTPCDPSICGSTPESIAKFYAENPALLAQLAQSKRTDGGNIDPGRGDSTGFAADTNAPAPTAGGQAIGMVGNPGQRGGIGESGSVDTSTNFGNSQGAGAINPGPEGNMATTGGRSESVDDRINGQPQRDFPNNTQGSSANNSGSPVTTPRTPNSPTAKAPTVKCAPNHPIPAFRCP
jgi:hypothetical protein